MPTVSIVLPNYNYAKYLDERIQSLLSQTYQDFELIILDDASTDNSLDIIYKYVEDPRIKTQFYTQNSGLPYKRWNDGADLAQGKYLMIAGADDSCSPELVSELVEKLEFNPQVGLAYAQSWNINSAGDKTHLWKNWTDDLDLNRWSKDFINCGKEECKYLLLKNTIPNASAVLMRRKVFVEAGKFDSQLRLAADWMLWAKMLTVSDVAYVAEPLNYFRTHTNAVRNTTRAVLELKERLQVIRYLIQQVEPQKQFWETVYNPSVGWWMRLMASGKISARENVEIYKLLRDINPKINSQILTNLADTLKRKIKSIGDRA